MDKFPKYVRKNKNLYPSPGMIDSFYEKYPEYSDVTRTELKNISRLFGKKFCEEVTKSRSGVMLPDKLGVFFIGCSKPRRRVKSYDNYTNNKKVTYSNVHTDGLLMKIYYVASASKVPPRFYSCWTFKPSDVFKDRAINAFKENWNKYVVTNNMKISSLFGGEENMFSNSRYKKAQKYNELDI